MIRRLTARVSVALVLAACSAPPPASSSDGSSGSAQRAAAAGEAPSLYGRWSIVEVDGAPARGLRSDLPIKPEASFAPGGYGGASGCNSFGGAGLLVGDRWFADPAMATQQGCGDLDRQESTIFTVLAAGPVLQWEGSDVVVLRAARNTLRLRRIGPVQERGDRVLGAATESREPPLLAGTRWEFRMLDGAPLDMAGAKQPVRLALEADRWTLETPCATRTGAWRQSEGAVVLEPGPTTARACPAPLKAPSEALSRAVAGRLDYVVGPNDEFVLAGREHWLVGRGDRSLAREPADPLSGQWRVSAVDGVAPPASERPPELTFGGGGFGVWDGCRHSEGVAITFGRQLFTHGSGVVTMANCPADPVRAKINSVVGSRPRIGLTADGGRALVSQAGTLRLQRVSSRTFGTGVETRLRSGRAFDLMAGDAGPARLTLGPGDTFTLTLRCGTMNGRWRSASGLSGPYTRFGPDRPPQGCDGDQEATRLSHFFIGDVQAAIGPNNDIALFVNRGRGLPARVWPPR